MKMQIYTDFIFKYICLVIDYTDGVLFASLVARR